MTNKKQNKSTGDLGEEIAAQFLKKRGYVILDRNYGDNWGELDIVAQYNDIVHFIEVKTLSYQSKAALLHAKQTDSWRPEEQVHARKLHQIHKALEIWLEKHKWAGEWQIDVVAVRLVASEKYATIKLIDNVILDR